VRLWGVLGADIFPRRWRPGEHGVAAKMRQLSGTETSQGRRAGAALPISAQGHRPSTTKRRHRLSRADLAAETAPNRCTKRPAAPGRSGRARKTLSPSAALPWRPLFRYAHCQDPSPFRRKRIVMKRTAADKEPT
jgi:hypothetical protein